MKIRYLEIEEVLAIHEVMISKFGGRLPIHDFTMLHSAISRPQVTFAGKDLYPGLFEKAAALVHSLILNHPFDDGNKRTAIASCTRFLFINGYELRFKKAEAIKFTLDIEAKRINFEEIVSWFKRHSRKKL